MKTGFSLDKKTITAIILQKLLEYLVDNADEILEKIKGSFVTARMDTEVIDAVNDFGYQPTEESLTKLHEVLEAKGEDTQQLAKILINNAHV